MSDHMMNEKPPFMIALLGYGGALPFLGLAACTYFNVALPGVSPVEGLLTYGAVILSFIGALHWGGVMAQHEQVVPRLASLLYGWSVMPALIAWAALLMPDRVGATVMALCFVACWRIDMRVIKSGLWPAWMARLRLHLTSCAVASLAVIVLLPYEVA